MTELQNIYKGTCKVNQDLIKICHLCEYCVKPPETLSVINFDTTETINIDGVCKKSRCRIVQNDRYKILIIGEECVVLEDHREHKLFRVPIESVYDVKLRKETNQ